MTEVEAQKLVTMLRAAYPAAMSRLDPDDVAETMAVYRTMLVDLDASAAAIAVKRLLSTSRFMPTIAEIREAIAQSELGGRRAGGEAWGDVLAAIHAFGAYRSPLFDDPLVGHAVGSLGWGELCASDNQAADRARFIELYDRLSTNARREEQMPREIRQALPGVRVHRELSAGAAIAHALPASTAAEPADRATLADWLAVSRGDG